MALLDFENFARETANVSNWFNASSPAVSGDLAGPFSYGRYTDGPSYLGRNMVASSVIWMQGHVWIGLTPSGTGPLFVVSDTGTTQCGVGLGPEMRIIIFYAGGTLYTPLPVMAISAWYFIQVRFSIANAGGKIDVYVNGTLVLTYTGDTQTTANNTANQWRIANVGGFNRFTNLVLYDETGAAPNARTPETRIYSDLPTGAGASTAWTPSAGANYQCVDEQPHDGDTTYNSAAAAGLDDLYGYAAGTIPATAVVYAVAEEYDARKDDAGTNDVDALLRSGGTTYAAGEVRTLTATWQRFRSHWNTDPATGAAWTPAGANAAQVGIRRTA